MLENAEELTNPLLLLVEPGRSPVIDSGTEALRARLTALGRPPDHLELDPGRVEQFARGSTPAAAAMGTAARGHVSTYFTWAHFRSRILAGYAEARRRTGT